ncbi:hypothetical protein EG329_011962 [Mollisiaceae sp. DMI_Dod_QoI]|nr:hypothetical protein EG329_011962 [Helotiales sp. DMI_Dod_QoI]
MHTESRLCRYCDELTISKLDDLSRLCIAQLYGPTTIRNTPENGFLPLQPSFPQLVRAAEEGCWLCQAIRDAFAAKKCCIDDVENRLELQLNTRIGILMASDFPHGHQNPFFNKLFVRVGFDPEETESGMEYAKRAMKGKESKSVKKENVSANLASGAVPESNIHSEMHHFECGARVIILSLIKSQDPLPILEVWRIGEPYRGNGLNSQEIFDLNRQWLDDCLMNHPDETCPKLEEKPFPTRLIEIGSEDGSVAPRLISSSGQSGFYAALSHCWGGNRPLKTTAETLEAYSSSLPLSLIPKTFRDAMTITRKLGFRFLWIDSLCIVQDSKVDWEKESAVMDLVYSNATITVSASGSPNSETGIFDALQEKPKTCGLLKLNTGSSPRECVQVSTFTGDEDLEDTLFRLPLATRGWAWQERLVSQRVLHYGLRATYWQCRTNHISSAGEHKSATPEPLSDMLSGRLLTLPPPLDFFNINERDALNPNSTWLEVVEGYCCSRELTFPNDKLPAMAGLARAFKKLTEDTYLAGLWKSDWARGALWQTGPPATNIVYTRQKHHKVSNRAPSWSWARWDGQIHFPLRQFALVRNHLTANLTRHDIKLAGANPLGEVSFGSLRIRAWGARKTVSEMNSLGTLWLDDLALITPAENRRGQGSIIYDTFGTENFRVVFFGEFSKDGEFVKNREVTRRGFLILNDLLTTTDGGIMCERVGVVVSSTYTYPEFDMTGWSLEDVTLI